MIGRVTQKAFGLSATFADRQGTSVHVKLENASFSWALTVLIFDFQQEWRRASF